MKSVGNCMRKLGGDFWRDWGAWWCK